MDDNCEFNKYHEYQYMPGDTKKEYPFVEEPYHVSFVDVLNCSMELSCVHLLWVTELAIQNVKNLVQDIKDIWNAKMVQRYLRIGIGKLNKKNMAYQ